MSDLKIGNLNSMLEQRLLGADRVSAAKKPMASVEAGSASSSQSSASFLDTLKGAIETTNELQKGADGAAQEFAKGKGSLHETMIAMEKADLALRTITQVRGKLIDAYQEVMKMPV